MSAPLLSPRGAIDVLEAAAGEADQVSSWIDGVTSALCRLMPSPLGGAATMVERLDESVRVLHTTTGLGLSPELAEVAAGHLASQESVDRFYFACQHVDTMSDILPGVSERVRLIADAFLSSVHAGDIVGLTARSELGHALVVASLRPTRTHNEKSDAGFRA